jgi:hypothetical protein
MTTDDTITADIIASLWAEGDRARALALAAQSRGLDAEACRIRLGHEAARDPEFYRAGRVDPDALIADAYAAMSRRYGLPL